MAKEITIDRTQTLLDRFPYLKQDHEVVVTLSMENSPDQPGLDAFRVKLFIHGNKIKGLTLEKSAESLYAALAEVMEHALERVNRYGYCRRAWQGRPHYRGHLLTADQGPQAGFQIKFRMGGKNKVIEN